MGLTSHSKASRRGLDADWLLVTASGKHTVVVVVVVLLRWTVSQTATEYCTTPSAIIPVARCLYFGVRLLLHCTSAPTQTILIIKRSNKKKATKLEQLQIFLLLHPFDVCLFAPHFRFSLHTFHLTHFRNTSLAFSEPLPSLRSVIFLFGRTE